MLIQRNGRTVKGLIDVARDGYIWFLERSAGPIKFVEGKPFVHQDVFKSLDPGTGRPEVDPERKPKTGVRADFCPGKLLGVRLALFPPEEFAHLEQVRTQRQVARVPGVGNVAVGLHRLHQAIEIQPHARLPHGQPLPQAKPSGP